MCPALYWDSSGAMIAVFFSVSATAKIYLTRVRFLHTHANMPVQALRDTRTKKNKKPVNQVSPLRISVWPDNVVLAIIPHDPCPRTLRTMKKICPSDSTQLRKNQLAQVSLYSEYFPRCALLCYTQSIPWL